MLTLHLQGTPVGAAEGDGDGYSAAQRLAEARIAGVEVLRVQMPKNQRDETIGEHGDERVSVGCSTFSLSIGRRPGTDFKERNTASRSVGIL